MSDGGKRDLAYPTLHLNGSDPDSLVEAYTSTLTVLRHAAQMMSLVEPHERDYCFDPVAFNHAQIEHASRLSRLLTVQDELFAILTNIQDQIDARSMQGHMKRFAITHVDINGLRTLTLSKQGRDTWGTREEAEQWLAAARDSLRCKSLGVLANSLRVDEVECYAHGDPVSTYHGEGPAHRLQAGDAVRRADTSHDDPSFKSLHGRVVCVDGDRAQVHWICDASPEFCMRPIWQLEKIDGV